MQSKAQYGHTLEPLRHQLRHHRLYGALKSVDDIRVFMRYHVFAVWDFMSLLKALQASLTCVTVPWMPTDNSIATRLINQVVRDEESDLDMEGRPKSHFEMYVEAMEQIGAETAPITNFLQQIDAGNCVANALADLDIPAPIKSFTSFTFSVIETGQMHLIASAFAFGREEVIPDMFLEILNGADADNVRYDRLVHYLKRHIELDGDEHGELALQMVSELCEDDDFRWQEALATGEESLRQRNALWDAINHQIEFSRFPATVSVS